MEIEIKLSPVYPHTAEKIMESTLHFVSAPKVFNMAADYFDTPCRELKKAGLTLRLRRENDLGVCCLKYRVSNTARFEAEESADTVEDGISLLLNRQDLSENIKNILKTAHVIPLYSSSFKRISRLVQQEKSVIELSFDCGYLKQQDRFLPISEIELELKEGEEKDMVTLARTLCKDYSLSVFTHSKAQRAAGLTEEAFAKMTPVTLEKPTDEEIYSGKVFISKNDENLVYYRKNEE